MKAVHSLQLSALLSKNTQHRQNTLVSSCLAALRLGSIKNYGSSEVRTTELIEIYQRRSEYKHLIAEGFETVLAALRVTADALTRIHGFTAKNIHYVIFTSIDHKKLLGIVAVKDSAGPFQI